MNFKWTVLGMAVAGVLALNAPAFAEEEMAPAGDAVKGKKVFTKCKACHTDDKSGKNKVGPNLWGIVDRGIAEVEGFKYSSAFEGKKGEVVWDVETLTTYLAAPKKWEPKTKMAFPGIKKEEDLHDLVAYLQTLRDE